MKNSLNVDRLSIPESPAPVPAAVRLQEPRTRLSLLDRALDLFRRQAFLALLDQTFLSGTRFFTTVIVGRLCGADEVGVYAVVFSLLVLAQVVQESLLMGPYTVFGNRRSGRSRARYAGSALLQTGLLALIGVGLLVLVAQFSDWNGGPAALPRVVLVLAAVLPFSLLHQFGRRFAFAHMKTGTALRLDLAVSAIQVGGLVALAATGLLSAAGAIFAMGAASALSGIAWFLYSRQDFIFSRRQFLPALQRNWSFGRWLFGAQVAQNLTWQVSTWLIVFVLGETSAGIFAVCLSLVFFANPLILGLNNFLAPYTTRQLLQGGTPRVRSLVIRAMLAVGGLMTLFCIAIALLGEEILVRLYGNPIYQGHTVVIVVLAASWAVSATSVAANNGIWAMERPQLNFLAAGVGLLAMVVTASLLIQPFGVLGVACGLLAGSIVHSGLRTILFFRLLNLPMRSGVALFQPAKGTSNESSS